MKQKFKTGDKVELLAIPKELLPDDMPSMSKYYGCVGFIGDFGADMSDDGSYWRYDVLGWWWPEQCLRLIDTSKEMKNKTNVIQWAKSKGILDKATPLTQALKTLEEVTELLQAINKGDIDETLDAYGDILVTIIIGAHMSGLDIEDCLESAYNIIAKRTGKMVNGTFVKDDNKACLICGGDFDNPMQEHLGACGSCFANRRPY